MRKGCHIVLCPIIVPEGGLCFDHKKEVICPQFDNTGGHPHCHLGFGNFIDRKGEYCKSELCLSLEELEIKS
jgi:hypothetical protein